MGWRGSILTEFLGGRLLQVAMYSVWSQFTWCWLRTHVILKRSFKGTISRKRRRLSLPSLVRLLEFEGTFDFDLIHFIMSLARRSRNIVETNEQKSTNFTSIEIQTPLELMTCLGLSWNRTQRSRRYCWKRHLFYHRIVFHAFFDIVSSLVVQVQVDILLKTSNSKVPVNGSWPTQTWNWDQK